MKPERLFYSAASLLMLALAFWGFHHFYLEGLEDDSTPIPRRIAPYVVVHGVALTLWIILFAVQALLIASRNARIHMRLGWVAAAAALAVVATSPLTAVAAIRERPAEMVFGLTYPQFLAPMLADVLCFAAFVAIGLSVRKRPELHRPMMLLATLSVISAATSRIPLLDSLLGETGWIRHFGPVAALGAVLLAVRCALTRSLDRAFALGWAAQTLVFLAATGLATSEAWTRFANAVAHR